MEIKDFVKETLVQITSGIHDSQEEVRKKGGFVNPYRANVLKSDNSHFASIETGQNVFLVDFTIGVTVVEATGTDAKAKLNVAGFLNLGAGGESSQNTSTINNISFKVPLALPSDTESTEKLRQREAQEREEFERKKRQMSSRGEW